MIYGGRWDPTDVTADAIFEYTNQRATVNNDAGGHGSVRSFTSKSGIGNKRYVEVMIDDYGSDPNLSIVVGFSATGSAMAHNWNNAGNANFSFYGGGGTGTRYAYGQSSTDNSDNTWLGWPSTTSGTAPDVFRFAIDIGNTVSVGLNAPGDDSGNLLGMYASPAGFYPETDVKVHASLGDGNFGVIGTGIRMTILTTAVTQFYPAPPGYTAWDD